MPPRPLRPPTQKHLPLSTTIVYGAVRACVQFHARPLAQLPQFRARPETSLQHRVHSPRARRRALPWFQSARPSLTPILLGFELCRRAVSPGPRVVQSIRDRCSRHSLHFLLFFCCCRALGPKKKKPKQQTPAFELTVAAFTPPPLRAPLRCTRIREIRLQFIAAPTATIPPPFLQTPIPPPVVFFSTV